MRREVKSKGLTGERADAYIQNALAEEQCLKNLGTTVEVTPRGSSQQSHKRITRAVKSNTSFQGSFNQQSQGKIASNIGFTPVISRRTYGGYTPTKGSNPYNDGSPNRDLKATRS